MLCFGERPKCDIYDHRVTATPECIAALVTNPPQFCNTLGTPAFSSRSPDDDMSFPSTNPPQYDEQQVSKLRVLYLLGVCVPGNGDPLMIDIDHHTGQSGAHQNERSGLPLVILSCLKNERGYTRPRKM